MNPVTYVNTLRHRFTSAEAALTSPFAKECPKVVRDALALVRDGKGKLFRTAFLGRLSTRKWREETEAEVLIRRAARYGCRRQDFARAVSNAAERWAYPPNLQRVVTSSYGSVTIPGAHFPWFGNPKYLSLTGDGLPQVMLRVLATDEGGPCRFKLVRRDDPELRADVGAMTTIPECIRKERLGAQRYPDFHYQPGLCDWIRERGLDGELDLDDFERLLRAVFAPPSVWATPTPRPAVPSPTPPRDSELVAVITSLDT